MVSTINSPNGRLNHLSGSCRDRGSRGHRPALPYLDRDRSPSVSPDRSLTDRSRTYVPDSDIEVDPDDDDVEEEEQEELGPLDDDDEDEEDDEEDEDVDDGDEDDEDGEEPYHSGNEEAIRVFVCSDSGPKPVLPPPTNSRSKEDKDFDGSS